jgi:S-adenosylmethionine hydrolase
MADKRSIVTLTTDFGDADYYVGAIKGVIYSINQNVDIVDITHQIPAHDIYSAAFTLMCASREFPRNTIHLVVVDPGVGSTRRPIMVMADDHYFVGPDNGVFSYVYQRQEVHRIVHLTSEHYFRQPVSATFHGRDVFAPTAGYLSKSVEWRMLGEEIADPVRFNTPTPTWISGRQVRGSVIHVDRFGNIITSVSTAELTEEKIRAGVHVRVGKHEAARLLTHFAEAERDELFAYIGSAGFLELAVNRQSAARITEARRGVEVEVIIG